MDLEVDDREDRVRDHLPLHVAAAAVRLAEHIHGAKEGDCGVQSAGEKPAGKNHVAITHQTIACRSGRARRELDWRVSHDKPGREVQRGKGETLRRDAESTRWNTWSPKLVCHSRLSTAAAFGGGMHLLRKYVELGVAHHDGIVDVALEGGDEEYGKAVNI